MAILNQRRLVDEGVPDRLIQKELFDLQKDPHYMDNVAADPAYESVRQGLSDRLMALLREQNDPRVVETPCRFEHAPYAGPVQD